MRAKFDRIIAWINQMRPPATVDVGRVSFWLTFPSKYISFGKVDPRLISGYMAVCGYPPKKIIYLLFFLSFFILLVRTHLRRYTFIAKITAKYRCKKHSRISKGANQRNSVLWNVFYSLYHLFASLSKRNDADVVPQARVESVTSF